MQLIITPNKSIIYLLIISTFFGASFLTFDIGLFNLFPFRIFLIASLLYFATFYYSNPLRLGLIKVKNYLYFFLGWIFYSLFSMAWAASKLDAIRYNLLLISGILIIFFCIVSFTKINDYKRIVHVWGACLFILIMWGLWNNLTGFNFNNFEVTLIEQSSALRGTIFYPPRGPFRNQNDYATILAISIPLFFIIGRLNKKITVKFVSLSLSALSFYLIAMAYSRANMIAVIIGVSCWVFIFSNVKIRYKTLIAFLAVAILIAIIIPNFAEQTYTYFTMGIESLIKGLFSVGETAGMSVEARKNLLNNGLLFLLQSWGFGVGAGNTEFYMMHFQKYNTHGILNAHSWFIEIMINYGIFILLGYLMAIFFILLSLYKYSINSTNPLAKTIAQGFFISNIIFLFSSFSSSSVIAIMPVWLLTAITLGFINSYRLNMVKIQ